MGESRVQVQQAEARDPMAVSAEAQAHRRKLTFWRRMAWLLVGVAAVIAVFLWQLGQARRASCRAALEHYARLAEETDLASSPRQLLGLQWRSLPTGSASLPAAHYALLTFNWLPSLEADEKRPLAVCKDPHSILFARRRHVLFRVGRDVKIEWLSEDQVDSIVQAATKGDLP